MLFFMLNISKESCSRSRKDTISNGHNSNGKNSEQKQSQMVALQNGAYISIVAIVQ